VTEQLPLARLQADGFSGPVTPVALNVTVPVGVVGFEEVSVTVTVHVDPWLTTTGVLQVTTVVVECGGTATTEMVDIPLAPV
jgi:hypothetical protein